MRRSPPCTQLRMLSPMLSQTIKRFATNSMILSTLPCNSQEMLGCGTCRFLETHGLSSGGDNVKIVCDMERRIVRLINLSAHFAVPN